MAPPLRVTALRGGVSLADYARSQIEITIEFHPKAINKVTAVAIVTATAM